jgi:hypothetical protein
MSLLFESFAYNRGLPADADFVFDARALPNPHWDARLRPLSGRDPSVREHLDGDPLVQAFLGQVRGFLDEWVPRFASETRSYLTVAFGCTGGRHRSVYLAESLAGYAGFATRGFHIAALFDADPHRVGERVGSLTVRDIAEVEAVVEAESISIGVIATPAHAAQRVADRLVAAGVTSILNFAPCVLVVPDGVDVRKVDLAIELQILSFHEHRKSALTALPAKAVGQ